MLIPMTLSLFGPYAVLWCVDRVAPRLATSGTTKGRLGISCFLVGPAVAHFLTPEAFVAMLPPAIPWRAEIVYATGGLELLGAIGIWIPGLTRIAGVAIVLMLIGFLPANVYAALARVDYGGSSAGPAYLWVRVPFQFVAIAWVAWWTVRRTDTPTDRVS